MKFRQNTTGLKKSVLMCAGSALGIACLGAFPVVAQEEGAQSEAGEDSTVTFGKITVTARKRAESLQDVPLSIQAFTAEALDSADIDNLDELAAYTPGLTLFENVDRGYGQVFVRGLQNTPPRGDTTRELASVFIDGVFFTGGVSAINTDNIERVEVIRGPQSALFGRATFSGAINFITKTPAEEFSANIRTYLATDDEYEVSGSVEGPLIKDVLSGRLSARYREFGGQYTNTVNGAPLGEQEEHSFSGQLYFNPTENFSAKLSGTYLEQADGPAASALVGRLPNHNFTSPSGTTFFRGVQGLDTAIAQNEFPSDPNDILGLGAGELVPFDTLPDAGRLGIRRNGLDREFTFVSLDTTYEFDNGYALTYLGGFSDETAARLWDFELSPEDNYYGQRNSDSESSSHEIRFASPDDDRFTWLAGVSYFNQTLYERDPGFAFGIDNPFIPFAREPGQVGIFPGPRPIVDREINTYAVFGSASYDFTDNVSASVEVRYQDDELEDVVDPDAGETLSGSTDSWLPRFFLEYTPNSNTLLYASAAKGIRPTTINSQFAARSEDEKAIIRAEFPELDIDLLAPPEAIWTYEIGAKSTLLDGRAVLNANIYYSDWQDSQDLRSLFADVDGDMVPDSTLVTVNGADIEAKGIELDGFLAVTNELSLTGAVAWNHAELQGENATITRFFLDENAGGARLPLTPEYSGNLAATYKTRFGNTGFDWWGRVEGIYVGSRYATALNLAETGESTEINLRFGLENDRYSAQIFATNITDDDTFESLAGNADCATSAACSTRANEAVLARKGQVGIILQANF